MRLLRVSDADVDDGASGRGVHDAPAQCPQLAAVEELHGFVEKSGRLFLEPIDHAVFLTQNPSGEGPDEPDLEDSMPGQDAEWELCTDKVLSKGRILQELTKAVKLVRRYEWLCSSGNSLPVYLNHSKDCFISL